jgi:hypothetical protein
MTLAQEIDTADARSSVRLADTPEGLAVIHRPDCAAAIWRRSPAPIFQSWIDALDPDQLPRARVMLRPEDVRKAATQICETCGTPEGPERRMLVDDTAVLARIFADLMRARFLALRFDVTATNACRKFHIDTVTARLVCTYRGTGTQYGFPTVDADPPEVFTVATGAPILLRGKLWPERPNAGLRHRSPPIEGTGETRLVLVLDPIDDPDDVPSATRMH